MPFSCTLRLGASRSAARSALAAGVVVALAAGALVAAWGCAAGPDPLPEEPRERACALVARLVVERRPFGPLGGGDLAPSDEYDDMIRGLVALAPVPEAGVVELLGDVIERDDAPGHEVRRRGAGEVLEALAARGHAAAVDALARMLDLPDAGAVGRLAAARRRGGFPAAWLIHRAHAAAPPGRRRASLAAALAVTVPPGLHARLAREAARLVCRDLPPGQRVAVMPCDDLLDDPAGASAASGALERALVRLGALEVVERAGAGADERARLMELARRDPFTAGDAGPAPGRMRPAQTLLFPTATFDGLSIEAVDATSGEVRAAWFLPSGEFAADPFTALSHSVAADFSRADLGREAAERRARAAGGAFAIGPIEGDAGGIFARRLAAALFDLAPLGPRWVAQGHAGAVRAELARTSDDQYRPSPAAPGILPVTAWLTGALEPGSGGVDAAVSGGDSDTAGRPPPPRGPALSLRLVEVESGLILWKW
ncbi:MAG: hypothetical protein HY719_11870 [Planctomycetes bacterium]|nr:hypothetical protein [Planctomycetota bacterium]